MPIARLIADMDGLSARLDAALAELEASGIKVARAGLLDANGEVVQIAATGGDAAQMRSVIDKSFGSADVLVADEPIAAPQLFVSDMDSTMIGQECIDELADFAGVKDRVAAITERAMAGELDFAGALRERVALLEGLDESAIAQCLEERIRPMGGARTLLAGLKARGCRCVLVTGGFHHFADPVAEMLGFDRVVANRLGVAGGKLTGEVVGPICDSATKRDTLEEEAAAIGDAAITLAMGDGANDIPMLEAATYGIAYHAKAKARAAADGWIERGDLTNALALLGLSQHDGANA
ncbi:phosphoserine phosphatase SerB [Alteriqipengyuania flavescens]|uniref:phosphoserine phosphatase SerB n=1 Tax=Alteriqipengyuania flavescens TaxID=3053610 RepID=UPI0025B3F48B|nr:phosphoserine phosphatase SerB [Alteriqipengyuania flavescens]WJY18374.1 phosphoserine phosphatase SerB [Alteriqipengyuania flavescens]WJY24315.1 phosphoserine phosphatase SerB [Alteriqipengyuania flavescens]